MTAINEAEVWKLVAEQLGIAIVAPFTTVIDGTEVGFTALFPQFGSPLGMIVDRNWEVLEPHGKALLRAGYGFLCVGAGNPDDGSRSIH